MLTGVGCDLIEIERVKKACEKEAFFLRIYTENERRQAEGRPSALAGTFAAKEAVAKVFGTGFRSFGPIDIEVLRDELGKPYVVLHANAKKIAIITDSNSGIFPDEYSAQGVFVLPVPFIINGDTFFENITLTQEKFYQL